MPDTRETYLHPSVVEHYTREERLQAAERLIFERCVTRSMAVLDVGVGAGRTTAYLEKTAGGYVGIDNSPPMIARGHERFPHADLRVADATDLGEFPPCSFDAVIFSFNGLGSLQTDTERSRCLDEFSRVLRPRGLLIFSIHNARFLVTWPVLDDVAVLRAVWRVCYAAYKTARNLPHRLGTPTFWRGAGYLIDPALHGGLRVYTSTPGPLALELRAHGFEQELCVPAPDPRLRRPTIIPWYYYVARKKAEASG